MHRPLKAALAAVAGTGLLITGAGSLAWWNDAEAPPGVTVNDGELALGALDCGVGWTLDGETTVFDPVTQELSPGDTLTQTCTTTVTAVGEHLAAELALSAPAYTAGDAALQTALVESATFAVAGGASGLSSLALTEADDGKVVTATMQVAFPFGTAVDNTANDAALTATLDGFSLALTQTDSH